MKRKKLNCICGKPRQGHPILGGLLTLVLAALLFATPALAAGNNGVIPRATLQNKPEVTIQGNVVVDDNGAPTGFYELALCVRSPKRIVDINGVTATAGEEISEAAYNAYIAANPDSQGDFTVTYYPFAAASAVVEINADVLTAVNWDLETVTYSDWDGMNYADGDNAYPRGIDISANVDPEVWTDTDPEPFPDITTASLGGLHRIPVALDAEGDRSAFTVAAQVDDYQETATAKTALVTLSAHTPDNKPVIYTQSTPVAVVRFSYDLKRFPKNTVMVNAADGDARNYLTGTAADEGFWLGLDRGNNTTVNSGKTPLTWLANTALGTGGNNYDYSDARAAATEAGQVVWTKISSKDTGGATIADWTDTEYYYYLGAENPAGTGVEGSVPVALSGNDVPTTVDHVWIPNTASRIKILADGTAENPQPGPGDTWTQAQYSYYINIISLNGGLRLELVNAPTFRAPRGGKGGNQILFYDWDDKLIGALIVGKGDVRKDVNSYVERNFIAPELRASQYLNNGELPTDPTALANYENVVNSLDREFTYRGSQYPYKLNGGDALKDAKGDNYPLTNKLDYVFYKRLNLVNTLRTPDPSDPTNADKDTVENYYTVAKVNDDPETGKYPYIYGWAVVEDPANKKIETAGENWAVRLDSVKTESTWTTFDTGELGGLEPNYIAAGAIGKPVPATATFTYPGGMSADPVQPTLADYVTSSADANGYLRFADFSDMEAMLKLGQDVLIVKAVYEPGVELQKYANYTSVEGSLYTTRYSTDASTANAVYSVQYQYQRANNVNGDWQGVRRIREPAVETGYIYDINEFDNPNLGIDQDLNSNRSFSMKTLAVNSDIMDIDILSGGVIWKIDYVLRDLYGGLNVATGEMRSANGILDLKTGFNYEKPDNSGNEWTYDERQGTDSLIVDATIAQLLAEATKIARGESAESLVDYFSYDTVNDLNLRSDMQGTVFTMDYTDCADYTQGLVNAIVAAYPDPVTAPAGIYDKRGAVTLTWHQIQRHIIMAGAGNAAGIFSGGALMADGVCAGFPWCRYDSCSADVKMEINGLDDLLTAIHYVQSLPASDNNHKKAEEALKELTGAQFQGYGFRWHADGVPYDTTKGDDALKNAILDDMKDAVAILAPTLGTDPDWSKVTWTQLQEAIIRGNMGTATPTTMNFWWQPTTSAPNGTPPAITKWEDLLKYSYQALVGVDTNGDGTPDAVVPDAFNAFTPAKVSKTLLDAMIKEDVHGIATGDYASMGWLRKGVDSNGEAVEFASVAEFETAWKAAVQALAKPAPAGGGYDTPDKLKTATWEELQYALITGTYKSYTDILAETSGTAAGPLSGKPMYWNDGGQPVLKFDALLEAINEYYFSGGTNSTKLDKLLAKGVDPVNNQVYLRRDDTGSSFADVAQFKNAVYNAIQALQFFTYNGNSFVDSSSGTDKMVLDEYELQYMLIHYPEFGVTITTMPTSQEIRDAHTADETVNNYWWFDGGAPSGAMPIRTIKELFTAYFWYTGASAGVSGQNPDALNRLDETVMEALGLRQDLMGVPYQSVTLSDVVSALSATPYTAQLLSTASDADLAKELQYALLTGKYAPAASITDNYWWQKGDKSYPAPTNQKEVLEAVWKAYVGNAAGNTVPEAETALKAMDMDFITKRDTGLAMRQDTDGNAFANVGAFYTALTEAMDVLRAGGQSYADLGNITQRQLQWMLLGNAYDTDANVQDATIDKTDPANPVDAYWWFTSDKKPGTGPTKTEKPVDPAKWSTFIQALNNYAMLGDNTAFTDGTITLSMVNDDLLLRKADGSKFANWSEVYDDSYAEVITSALYAITADGDKYAEFWDQNDFVTLVKEPSWYELQYAIMHTDDINNTGVFPDLADCKKESEEKYEWKYEITGGEDPDPPTPTVTEKPVDPAQWSAFMQALNDYAMLGDTTAFDSGTITLSMVNDDLLLRKPDGSKFADWSEVYDGSYAEIITSALYAIMVDGDKYAEFWDPNDGCTMVKEPSWYELQYAIIHTDEINNTGVFPDLTDCKKESEEKYSWKYEVSGGGEPEPVVTEIPIDPAKWSTFIQGLNDYAMMGDPAAFDGGPLTNALSMVNDDLLLRKPDGSKFADWSEVYDGSYAEIITSALYAIMVDGDKYAEFWDQEDFVTLVKEPSWYEIQYAIIHMDEINNTGVFPSLADCQAECKEKYDWKYTTS